jgi:hypothetical protein
MERLAAHAGGARCLAFLRAICLDFFIAIALTAATAATGKEFSDFLTLGMPKFTKLCAYYNSVSIAAIGVGAGHPSPLKKPRMADRHESACRVNRTAQPELRPLPDCGRGAFASAAKAGASHFRLGRTLQASGSRDWTASAAKAGASQRGRAERLRQRVPGTRFIALPGRAGPPALAPGLGTARKSGKFLQGSAKKCKKVQ